MASTLKHSKKRNSGLAYEFLLRHMTRCLIEKNIVEYRNAHTIARKYFGPGSYLSRELEMFDTVRSARGLPESAARRVLFEVMRHAKSLDRKMLDIKKSNLIKELNYSFGKEFFSRYRLKEYRLFASLQLLLNSVHDRVTIKERVLDVLPIEEAVVKYMMSTTTVPERLQEGQKVDRLVLSLVSKSFQEKYGQSLNRKQKVLLETYARSIISGEHARLEGVVVSEVVRLKDVMERAAKMPEFREDPVMMQRLREATEKLDSLEGSFSGETVQEIMLFQRLSEEIGDG